MRISPLGFPWKTEDPFLFCVHHLDHYPKGNEKMEPSEGTAGRNLGSDFQVKDGWRMYHGRRIPGFPYHPHRGFETVTIAEQGVVDHSDSIGGAGRFSKGDVQWMTAGKGILHSEMFPMLNENDKNTLEIFQIWLNLPAKDKLVDPHFKMLWNEKIPVVKLDDNKVEVKVISGSEHDVEAVSPPPHSWAAKQEHDVKIHIIKMKPGASYNFGRTAPENNRNLYFYQGEKLKINKREMPAYHMLTMETDQEYQLHSQDECYVLYLEGKPINEPVAQHGPFVMNTAEEIQDAFAEYRRTGFGGWPWPLEEQTHGKVKQRFAKHADGKVEERDFISE